jgi:aspartyl-tRNA(Asn)/glutamyl-tRNA(Gln) amidotransferase subunit A
MDEPIPNYELVCDAADPERLRIGIAENYFMDQVESEQGAALTGSVHRLAKSGAKVRSVSLPDLRPALAAANIVIGVESLALHRRTLAQYPNGYSEPIRQRIENGLGYTGYEYLDALKYRAISIAGVMEAMREVDVLAVPALGIPTPTQIEAEDTQADSFSALVAKTTYWTRPVNYLGLPAISLPCGMTAGGLPIGLQLIGKPFQEARLLQAAATFEAIYDIPRVPESPAA